MGIVFLKPECPCPLNQEIPCTLPHYAPPQEKDWEPESTSETFMWLCVHVTSISTQLTFLP